MKKSTYVCAIIIGFLISIPSLYICFKYGHIQGLKTFMWGLFISAISFRAGCNEETKDTENKNNKER